MCFVKTWEAAKGDPHELDLAIAGSSGARVSVRLPIHFPDARISSEPSKRRDHPNELRRLTRGACLLNEVILLKLGFVPQIQDPRRMDHRKDMVVPGGQLVCSCQIGTCTPRLGCL